MSKVHEGNMKSLQELEVYLAKVLNGPFNDPPPGSPYTLDQLRDSRWRMLSEFEQANCLLKSRAVLRFLVRKNVRIDNLMK